MAKDSKKFEDVPDATNLTCDSCLRHNLPCIGHPCERCVLHDFDCLYSTPEAHISELQEQFRGLLHRSGSLSASRPLDMSAVGDAMKDSQVLEKTPLKWGCVTCRHRGMECGMRKLVCGECGREKLLCVYSEMGEGEERLRKDRKCSVCRYSGRECDGLGAGCRRDLLSYDTSLGNGRTSEEIEGDEKNTSREENDKGETKCSTCQIWHAYCDNERPTCSSCLVRNVSCNYPSPSPISTLATSSSLRPTNPIITLSDSTQRPSKPPKSSPTPNFVLTRDQNIADLRRKREKAIARRHRNTSKSTYQPLPNATPDPKLYASLFSPPISQMYSTPSGCISCFNGKMKCLPLAQGAASPSSSLSSSGGKVRGSRNGNGCQRCTSIGKDCMMFPPGTRLLACESCLDAGRACTNLKEGLRCDGCVDAGKRCSRSRFEEREEGMGVAIEHLDNARNETKEMRQGRLKMMGRVVVDYSQGTLGKTCVLCEKLGQFCDGVESGCALCVEVGLGCRFPAIEPQKVADTTDTAAIAAPDIDSATVTKTSNQPPSSTAPLSTRNKSVRPPQTSAKGQKKEKASYNKEELDMDTDWEEISHNEAFGVRKGLIQI